MSSPLKLHSNNSGFDRILSPEQSRDEYDQAYNRYKQQLKDAFDQ